MLKHNIYQNVTITLITAINIYKIKVTILRVGPKVTPLTKWLEESGHFCRY